MGPSGCPEAHVFVGEVKQTQSFFLVTSSTVHRVSRCLWDLVLDCLTNAQIHPCLSPLCRVLCSTQTCPLYTVTEQCLILCKCYVNRCVSPRAMWTDAIQMQYFPQIICICIWLPQRATGFDWLRSGRQGWRQELSLKSKLS